MKTKVLIIVIILAALLGWWKFDLNSKPEGVMRYYNAQYKYSFDYNASDVVLKDSDLSQIIVADSSDGYWFIQVDVSETGFSDVRKWADTKKSTYVQEQERLFQGIPALLLHNAGEGGEGEKTIALIKEGKLFLISSRGVNHGSLWESFIFYK